MRTYALVHDRFEQKHIIIFKDDDARGWIKLDFRHPETMGKIVDALNAQESHNGGS